MDRIINQIVPQRAEIQINDISVLYTNDFTLQIFDIRSIDFLNRISQTINKDKVLRTDAGIVALGFWLRKANIQKICNENQTLSNNPAYRASPIGTVFHICPANVDTMFLYSLALSLLMGNKNILRVSSRTDDQNIRILFDCINIILSEPEYNLFAGYLSIVNYEHNDEINIYLSNHANARVIWGGDTTVNLFRSYAVKSRMKDIVFPDRKSYALFRAASFTILAEPEKKEITKKFYNDSYSFDQKGCSSPQSIFVLGNQTEASIFKTEFYSLLSEMAGENYTNDITSLASLKFNQLVSDVIETSNSVRAINWQNNFTYFIDINDNTKLSETCGGGYFYIHHLQTLNDLLPHINREVQTISYFGLTNLDVDDLFHLSYSKGIDRIVPVGSALNFDYIWDGYNILDELCLKKKLV